MFYSVLAPHLSTQPLDISLLDTPSASKPTEKSSSSTPGSTPGAESQEKEQITIKTEPVGM